MIPTSFLNNLLPWVLQVLVVGSVGAALPRLFRIRHPRSQLIYFHMLLVVCLMLPLIQPWHHPLITAPALEHAADSAGIVSGPASNVGTSPQFSPRSWNEILFWILAAGIAGRLCWTLAGLWQLRRYRDGAMPIYPVPEAIAQARSIVKADAVFCAATGVGPVTFGFFRSVVLLPESFASLEPQAQLGVACHELLHVRRNDWLVTLLEEVVASLFWFHPAIWWMLGQTRLAREQVVDAEVVRLTSAPEPYIHALLAIAGARARLDLAPAPLFLHKRHLIQRMHFLLSEDSMSKLRLFCSYASMAAILALGGWAVLVSFPLVGRAVAAPAVVLQAQSNATEPSPGYVVNRTPATYPAEALRKRIEGSVVVELTFNANGEITDSRVLSGPEELRQAGLQTALSGSYNISVARTLQVVVDFKLPPAAAAPAAQRGNAAAPPAVPPAQPGARGGNPGNPAANLLSQFQGTLEAINIQGLQGSDLAQMQQRLQPYQGRPMTPDLFKEVINAAQSSGVSIPYRGISTSATAEHNTTLLVDFSSTPLRVRVGARVAAANLIQPAAAPVYPDAAKQQGVEGDVVLQVSISKEGNVEDVGVVSGHPLLVPAAINAVNQWHYNPTMLNGAAVDVVTNVTVSFKSPQ